jgi:hypothetical protein
MKSQLKRQIIGAAIWFALFLLMATRLPAEPAGTDMTASVDRAAVLEGRQ